MLSDVVRIDGRKVISSGVLYAEPGEQIIFYPFEGSREEGFRLEVIIVEAVPEEQIDYDLEDHLLIIKFHRTWNSGLEASATNIEIATDDVTEAVMLRFSCQYIGSRSQHLMKLSYTIFQADTDGSDIQA